MTEYKINFQVRTSSIRLIDETGKMIGVLSNYEAQKMAQEKNLDLVEITPNQFPALCKLMNYGKFKYDSQKKEKEIKRSSKVLPIKEVQFSPNVDKNDLKIKNRKIREFIEAGHKVRLVMKFKGRDLQHTDVGKAIFENIIKELEDVSKTEQNAEFSGNSFSVLLGHK